MRIHVCFLFFLKNFFWMTVCKIPELCELCAKHVTASNMRWKVVWLVFLWFSFDTTVCHIMNNEICMKIISFFKTFSFPFDIMLWFKTFTVLT